jgi:plasmid segregation protein ParM
MSELRDSFKQYFWKKSQVNFVYNGDPLTIVIRNVFVYAQGFAAMAPRIAQLMQVKRTHVVDIGGMTTDVLLLSEGAPDKYHSPAIGLITLENTLIGRVSARHDMTIEADHIEMVLQGQETLLPVEVRGTIAEAAQQHVDVILERLREMQIDLRATPAIFIGGGAILLREYLATSPMVAKPEFILDSNANAVGYQKLAEAQLIKNSGGV